MELQRVPRRFYKLRAKSVPIFLAVLVLLSVLCASAQKTTHDTSASQFPTSDAGKIADALRAGPSFITKDATILDWPSTQGGDYRVLRKGTSEWTCLPAFPGYQHDEPGCFDATFMSWVRQSLAGQEPHIDRIGIAYMYVGAWVPNVADKTNSPGSEFHVGPHIMIVSPHENQKELEPVSHDGSDGMPYVAHLPHGKDLYLVMPIEQATKP